MAQINRDSIISELNNSLDAPLNETQIIEIRNSFTKKYLNPLYVELKNLPNEQKGQLGKEINELKIQINEIIDDKILNVKAISDLANHEVNYDISIETSNFQNGSFNPITIVIDQIAEYFTRLNFTIQSGEEVVNIKYGFDNLNVPINHPSRATSETFYVGEDTILRSQNTSSSAQFIDGNSGKDIRIMNYGYVYRNDDDDASHSHQFNQIDFVWIKDGLSIKNLKWVIGGLVRHIFGPEIKTRFRLSNFPFTEPSFEVDASCPFCGGKGCQTCKQTGWIELLGCGVLHEKVMEASNIKIKTGIAAGLGIERIAMIKYGISDVRDLYSNDFKIMNQFRIKE